MSNFDWNKTIQELYVFDNLIDANTGKTVEIEYKSSPQLELFLEEIRKVGTYNGERFRKAMQEVDDATTTGRIDSTKENNSNTPKEG
jgi:hypothetical protein